MTEQKMYAIEKNAMLVESECFNDVMYAINKQGNGMHIIYRNIAIPVSYENVEMFAEEILSVWQHLSPKGGM